MWKIKYNREGKLKKNRTGEKYTTENVTGVENIMENKTGRKNMKENIEGPENIYVKN